MSLLFQPMLVMTPYGTFRSYFPPIRLFIFSHTKLFKYVIIVEVVGFGPTKTEANRVTVCPIWPLWYTSILAEVDRLELTHRFTDYLLFSGQLPYRLGLYFQSCRLFRAVKIVLMPDKIKQPFYRYSPMVRLICKCHLLYVPYSQSSCGWLLFRESDSNWRPLDYETSKLPLLHPDI